MLTFAEELVLLMIDDDSGRLINADSITIKYAMAGAVLMDLAQRNKIDTDLEKLRIVDNTETGIDLLDKYLSLIDKAEQSGNALFWVSLIANHYESIQETAINMLIDKGIINQVEKTFLWVFETRRYPVIDDKEEKEVKKRIIDLLLTDEIPSPRDAVLISLVDTCRLFPSILSVQEIDHLTPRIEQIRNLDLIGRAVSQAVEQLRLDIAQAMSMVPV